MIKRLLLLFLTVVFLGEARAQLFPAQATTQLTPPYSLFLADYVAPGSERLALNVFLRDVSRPDINVRFRLRIIGQGISIETKPEFIPAPVSLQGGVPLRLIGIDLAEYFEPRNLNFSGISQREYEQRGGLPEGLYQFSFEVLEYNRGVKISNTSNASAWLILNDPPIVNLPRDNDRIRPQDPQQVIFQWTPRHTGSPNAAFTTEYEFKLVELWPATRNPNDAILTSPPIFETTTRSTTLVYGPAETPLELGRRYAFQIKAKSIVGVEELNLFKNGGKSQVYTFQYGDACNVPQRILAEAAGATRFKVAWDAANSHTSWKLRYRRDTANAAWFTTTSSLPELEINSLLPTTTYEYELMAVCGTFESPYSPIASITTRETPVIAYSCGLPIEEFDLDPSQLIPELKKGDVIDAGDFDVKLLTVSGGNGIFSGEGAIEVPYFNQVKAKVVFDNIKVNNDKRLVAGVMNVTGGGVEIVPEGVMDFMDQLSEVLDIADSALNIIDALVQDNPPDPATFIADTLITVAGPLTVYPDLSNNGSVIVVDGNGNQQTLPPGTNYAITDDKGNGYLVDSKGQVTSTTAAQAKASASREFNLTMKFEKASNGLYGLDNKTIAALARNYETLNNNYAVSWKAVAANSNEGVVARLEDASIDASRIKYELSGTELVATTAGEPGKYLLNLIGKSAGTVDELIGRIPAAGENDKEQVLGKLNVVSYDKKTYNLVLVPVNHSDDNKTEYPHNINLLKDSLNKIYRQAVVEWTVRDEDNLEVSGLSDTFDDGQSNAFSNYTEDMKKVINAFLAKHSFDEDTYYIFLLNKPKTVSKLGFMPRKKQAGFVFLDTHGDDENLLVKTIAHELAHGAFRLQHLWEEYSELKINTTDNLMDYTSGTKLLKFQWDLIHDPVAVIGLFEDDEEGAMGVQVARCLFGAGLDFAFYYSAIWISACLDDETFPEDPSYTDFSTIVNYKDWNWSEAIVSAGVSCVGANLPSFLAPETTRLVAAGLAALGGVAEGFSVEMAKQYEISLKQLQQGTPPVENPSLLSVVNNLDWTPIIVNTASSAVITGVIGYIGGSAKFTAVVNKIKTKLSVVNFNAEKNKIINYFSERLNGGQVVNGARKTGINVVDEFLETLPKINNISNANLPAGYQIFTKNGSKYIRRINVSNPNTPRLMVDEAGTIVPYIKPQRLANSTKLRSNLESNLGITAPANHQAHHIVPSNVVENSPLHKEAIKRGLYDVDRAGNGKFLAETDEDFVALSEAYPTHFGSHPNYDIQIRNQIDDVLRANNLTTNSNFSNLSNQIIINMIDDVEDLALNVLENWMPSKLN